MNTLAKIQKQELLIANESLALNKLKKKYIKETAKFKKGNIIEFDGGIFGNKKAIGFINDIRYLESDKGLIRYSIKRLNKDLTPNKKDFSFYYRYEKEITLL